MRARFNRLAVTVLGACCAAFVALVPSQASETINYSYDALGRLVQVSHTGAVSRGASATYSYDRADNRSNVTVVTSWTSRASRAGDFNGDGRPDIFWQADDGSVADWLGQPGGTFSSNSNWSSNPGTMWHVVGIGDFNGDGRADIFWQEDDGTVSDWLGQADGTFIGNWNNFNTNPGTMWHVVGIGDFNGDGRADILWQADDGTVTDWLGQPGGTFSGNWNTFNNNPGKMWHVVGIGDFNGDGRADILWRADDGTLTDWYGQADGSFAGNWNNFNIGVDPSWKVIGVGDFNCDGRADILLRNDSGDLTEWQGAPTGNFVSQSMPYYHVATNLKVALIGDFNGDHCDDLLWRDTTGNVTEWLGSSSGAFTSNSAANNSLATNWHVVPQ